MELRKFIATTIREYLNEQQNSGILKLYHGTPNETINLNDSNIWLANEIEYAEIWGENIFEIDIKINNILDTYNDLFNKKYTLKQIAKYLEIKGVDTSDFKYVMRNYMDDDKYLFWELISKHKTISYNWLSLDIFSSGYEAISLFEYGYRKKDKGKTYLVNKPKNKILNIKKLK
jgi:hypothetical protein